ncbi:MAG: ATP-binding cassette domain-containing protein, partial [Bulleidia sp.]
MALLEVKHIGKNFGSTEVLKDISFSMNEGEALSFIGSSGSGKTTLLRCLNFLETPDRGQIVLNGEVLFDGARKNNVSDAEIRRKRLHFGLVFQSFNLFPQYTALENIMLAPKLSAGRNADLKQIEDNARRL